MEVPNDSTDLEENLVHSCEFRATIPPTTKESLIQCIGDERLVIFYAVTAHSSRIADILEERYGDNVKLLHLSQELAFVRIMPSLSIEQLLKELHDIPYFIRYIHMFMPSTSSCEIVFSPEELEKMAALRGEEESFDNNNMNNNDTGDRQDNDNQIKVKRKTKRQIHEEKIMQRQPLPKTLFGTFNFLDNIADQLTGKRIRLQVYPAVAREPLFNALESKGIVLAPSDFTHFLSVVIYQKRYWYSLMSREVFYVKHTSNFVEKDIQSRAFYKVKEAIERFNIPVQSNWKMIDIGAAPGGISHYLSTTVVPDGLVLAIDPANLTIPEIPHNMKFLQMRCEDAFEHAQQLGPFDMMICDINARPWPVMDMIGCLLPLLKVGGYFLWTVKLPPMSGYLSHVDIYMNRVYSEWRFKFGDHYDSHFETKWLLSNRYERMVLVQKKKEHGETVQLTNLLDYKQQ